MKDSTNTDAAIIQDTSDPNDTCATKSILLGTTRFKTAGICNRIAGSSIASMAITKRRNIFLDTFN